MAKWRKCVKLGRRWDCITFSSREQAVYSCKRSRTAGLRCKVTKGGAKRRRGGR